MTAHDTAAPDMHATILALCDALDADLVENERHRVSSPPWQPDQIQPVPAMRRTRRQDRTIQLTPEAPMHHVAILKNTATGRFHPMPFRAAPRPSDDVDVGSICRHRSIGHPTEGFRDLASAQAYLAECKTFWPTTLVIEWDGEGIPATTLDLPTMPQST